MGGDGFKARTTDAGIVFDANNTKGSLDVGVEDRKAKKVTERFVARSKSKDKSIASKTPQSLKRPQLSDLPSLKDSGSGPSASREPDEYQLMLKMVEPICTADPDDDFPTTTASFMLEDSKTPVLAKASKAKTKRKLTNVDIWNNVIRTDDD
ncbi:hypothetical protein R1sor_012545 [Riccia sorocarpa]|uniref:Uncharacterized protein n=1 Tax=Riccia sorocarpa TaxID=122646 RepID=A0ABD3I5Y6_9MARC